MNLRLLLMLACLAVPIWAQGQSAPDTLLPDLTPREVEILGELNIDFPNVQRKPLIGFNPPPRIYEVPQNRRPFVENYKQQAANLPESTLRRPETIGIGQGLQIQPHRLMLTLGAGRYLSRTVQVDAAHPLGARTGVYLHADYAGRSTFTPYDDIGDNADPTGRLQALEAPANRATGRVGLQTTRGTASFGVEGDGFWNQYDLTGVALREGGDPAFSLDREGRGLGMKLWGRTSLGRAVPVELSLRYAGTRYETQPAEAELDPRLFRTERRLDVQGRIGYHATVFQFTLDGDLTTGGLDSDALLAQDHMAYAVAPSVSFALEQRVRLRVGARLLGYKASARNVAPGQAAEARSASHVAPLARLDLFVHPALQLYVQNDPKREAHGLGDVMRLNPYTINEPELKPNLSTIDAEGGAIFYAGPVRVSGFGGIQRFQEYLFFEEAAHLGFAGGFFEALYGKAHITFVGGDVALALPGRVSASLGLTWRDGSLQDPQTDIPYFAALVAQARLGYRFLDAKGLVQITGSWQGERAVTRTAQAQLDPVMDVDLEASYFFRPHWAVYTHIYNVTTQRYAYWDGYPTAPWEALAGVRLRW